MDAADTQTNLSTLPSNAWLNTHSSHQPQPRPPSTPNLTAIYGKQKRHRETEKTGQKGADLGQKAVDYHNRGWLASGSDEGIVKIWDPAKGECIWTLEGHGDRITSVAWSHDGSRLASASLDETIKIWDPTTGECISTLKGGYGLCQWVWSVAWSHDDSRLALGSAWNAVGIWDLAADKPILQTLGLHQDTVKSLAWSHKQPAIG